MRFVNCGLQAEDYITLELSGFEITVLITELMLLHGILEKYFDKLKGISGFKTALLEAHSLMIERENGASLDILEHKILIGHPQQMVTYIFDDLVYIAGAFEETNIDYEDTFNKLMILKRHIIKLSDSDIELFKVPAEDVQHVKIKSVTVN